MEILSQVAAAVAAVYALIGAGWLMGRAGALDSAFSEKGMRLVIGFLYPCLMLRFILGNDALRHPENVWLPPLLGFLFLAVGVPVCALAARLLRLGDAPLRRTFAFVASVNNYGYIPIPLCAALFDAETVGVLLVFNLGVEAALWIFGPITLSGAHWDLKSLKKLLNPVLISLFAGLAVNALGVLDAAPETLRTAFLKFVEIAGAGAIPLALLLIGVSFDGIVGRFGFRPDWKVIAAGSVLRLGVLPALLFATMFFLPMGRELREVIVVQCAMPCAVFPILMSLHYGGNPRAAVQLVLATSALALFTIPAWLYAGSLFLK